MKKSEAIDFLNKEGWKKADARRALDSLDFKRNNSITKMMILRAVSKFAGTELDKRQQLQKGQKIQVTKKTNQINNYIQLIKELKASKSRPSRNFRTGFTQEIKQLKDQNKELLKTNQQLQKNQSAFSESSQSKFTPQIKKLSERNKELSDQNKELSKANRALKKDNKDLKNITDAIKLRLAQETKQLLQLKNSQIKKGLVKLLNSVLG